MNKIKHLKKKTKPLDKKFYVIAILIFILVSMVLIFSAFGIYFFSFKCPVIVLILAVPIIIACDHSGIRTFIFNKKIDDFFAKVGSFFISKTSQKKALKRIRTRDIPSELAKTFGLIFACICMTFRGIQLFVAPAVIGLSAFSLYRFLVLMRQDSYKPYYLTNIVGTILPMIDFCIYDLGDQQFGNYIMIGYGIVWIMLAISKNNLKVIYFVCLINVLLGSFRVINTKYDFKPPQKYSAMVTEMVIKHSRYNSGNIIVTSVYDTRFDNREFYVSKSEYNNMRIGEFVTINVHKGLLGLKSYELVENQ